MSSKYRAEFTYLAPILASLLFGTLCASLIKTASVEPYPVTPFSEETFGSLGSFANAFYFVILAGIGATLLYLLLKRRSHRLIAVLTGFALTTAVFVLSIVYLFAGLSGFDIPYADALTLLLAILITGITDYAIFRNKRRLANMAVLGIGGALGTFLGFSIPTESTVLILGFLAIYDTFAVYRGPVGKIAQGGLDQLRGLSFSFKDIPIAFGLMAGFLALLV
jgi:presenilin-like A22 family membrane protease